MTSPRAGCAGGQAAVRPGEPVWTPDYLESRGNPASAGDAFINDQDRKGREICRGDR